MSRTDYLIKRLREIKRVHVWADGMMWEGEPDICRHAADALEEYQKILDDLHKGKNIVVPHTKEHAQAMGAVANAFGKDLRITP